MAISKSKNNENSVNVALQELMVMEDDRQQAETEEKSRREQEQRRRQEEAERARIREEEQRRREEEGARLRVEREEAERRAAQERAEQERKLKIQLETREQARAKEQERLLAHELEIKRLDAQKKVVPKWLIALIALFVLGSAVGGFGWYRTSEAEKAAQRQAYVEERESMRRAAEEDLRLLQEAMVTAKRKEQALQDTLREAESRGDAEAMGKARSQLQEAQKKIRPGQCQAAARSKETWQEESQPRLER